MAEGKASIKVPLALASIWFLTASLSALSAPVLIATVLYWHEVRIHLAQIAQWQTWISIAACLGLLMLSKRKHAETQEAWGQGALLIFVLGGLVTAILLNYGVLPQWWVKSASLLLMVQVLVLMALHWVCALLTLRSLLNFRKRA
jgi:hypothetical protein